jgi:hypothetical protein
MKASLLVVTAVVCLVGCQPSVDANNVKSEGPTPSSTPPPTAKSGGVAPMAAGAGGMTPMSGTDSVGGEGGGGVGQSAKQMAKDKAGNMGSGSLGQGSTDDSGQ